MQAFLLDLNNFSWSLAPFGGISTTKLKDQATTFDKYTCMYIQGVVTVVLIVAIKKKLQKCYWISSHINFQNVISKKNCQLYFYF